MMAYARGLFAAMLVAGSIGGFVALASHFGGAHLRNPDPALIREDAAQDILSALRDQEAADNCDPFDTRPRPFDKRDALVQLARIRAMIALGQARESLERRTDELLAQIESAVDQ